MKNNVTNLQHLLNSVARAQETIMMVFKNGQQYNEGYVVVNKGNAYNVGVENGQITNCTCPHHSHRGVVCKHMVKVSMEKNLNIRGLTVVAESPSNVTQLPIAQ